MMPLNPCTITTTSLLQTDTTRLRWATWQQEGDQTEQRQEAITRLERCIRMQLTTLDLSHLALTTLPPLLPDGLRILHASCNQLTTLPQPLPTSLQQLSIGGNRLAQLPPLPPNLDGLFVSNNELTALPDQLPESLTKLIAENNQLTALPQLPVGLKELYVTNNRLRALPDSLPDGLISLFVEDNPLRYLPPSLPTALEELHVDSHLLPPRWSRRSTSPLLIGFTSAQRPRYRSRMGRLGLYPYFSSVSSRSTPRRSNPLLNSISQWTANTTPWETIQHESNSYVFARFLQKLRGGRHEQNQLLRVHVADWLDYLANENNASLRAHTFLIAWEANANCVDRAAFYFNQMYIAKMEHQLIESHPSLTHLLDSNRAFFRLQLLEKIASQQVAVRRQQEADFSEEIEVYLAYQYRLHRQLSLPIYAELQYVRIANVTDRALEEALAMVYREEKQHFMRYLVTESQSWQSQLQHWNNQAVQRVNDAYLESLTGDQFNQSVDQILIDRALPIDNADARSAIEKEHADHLLYQRRCQLTLQFLTEQQAVDLINPFDYPNKIADHPIDKK